MTKRSRSIENINLLRENTLQKFVFELLSYSNVDELRKIFPDDFIKKGQNIKVIIPEFPLNENGINHITDFRVILNDVNETAFNVEVEWATSKFNHGEDVFNQYYADGKGFVIALQKDDSFNYMDDQSVSILDPEQLSYWFLSRAKNIVDGTISNHLKDYSPRNRKYWVIYISSSGGSIPDFLNKGIKNGKWAFRYPSPSKKYLMKNIFEITKGDIVVFVIGMKKLSTRKFIHGETYFTGAAVVDVKNGYYLDFKDETFETVEWKTLKASVPETEYITKKEYMHYFDFNNSTKSLKQYDIQLSGLKIPSYDKETYEKLNRYKSLSDWNDFISSAMESLNSSGAPVEISVDQFNAFLVQTRSI
ncbi:hypothetical protein PNF31_01535 [Priestia megaterium]|uniref:hypothetical protein n=1 Tax=Priestia TaxID=2800373 RepID=UPI00159439BE|nr:hypothetical protein [Priestia megaterium]MDC7719490.1 hypothetical protein [Priestia megaterium]